MVWHTPLRAPLKGSVVKRFRVMSIASIAAIALLAACGQSDNTNSAAGAGGSSESCFKGKDIDFAVPYDAGGGYDQYARLAAPYLEKQLDATIVVLNEPGAGGLLSLNKNAAANPKKPRLQIMEGFSSVGAQIGGGEGVNYDLRKWPWVGRFIAEPEIVYVAKNSPYKTWDDILASGKELKFGSAGPGGSDFIQGTVLKQAFNVPFKLTTGYKGGPDILAGLLRDDVQITETSLFTTLKYVKAGEVTPVLAIASKRTDDLPDVPIASEYKGKMAPQGEAAINGLVSMIEVGRAVATTPGISANCLTELQDAFSAVVKDPAFLKQAEDAGRPVQDPLSGVEMQQLVKKLYSDAAGSPLEATLTSVYANN
jgi:tripartite-type tricarboxylate transporter receptor subunit TctC